MENKNVRILVIVLAIVIIAAALLFMVFNNKEKNVEGSLEDVMTKVYSGIPEEELPMVANTVVTNENIEYYLGTNKVEFKEGLASEALIGSIPHSIVLLRTKDGANTEEIKKTIKESVNPRKWICVEAENVMVENKGDLVILIMVSENADKYEANFKNLK